MPVSPDFQATYQQLRTLLQPYAPNFHVKVDNLEGYYLEGDDMPERKDYKLFFASAQVKKSYVSYYLMPVYMYPELLEGLSPELRKRMQGKSCFNFKKPEPALFAELAELTRAGFERFQSEGLVK